MNVYANVQVKDEEILLKEILPIWKEYPIDKWVFLDDNSSDKTASLIKDTMGRKAVVIKNTESRYNPMKNRSQMLQYSRDKGASHIVSLNADELISANILTDFPKMIELNSTYNILYYTFEAVRDINHHRIDSSHEKDFRNFIFPLSHAGNFESEGMSAHTIKAPPIYLPPVMTRDAGIIHLHRLNTRYYALKNLWYKHRDYKEYLSSINDINSTYDVLVNNLNFEAEETLAKITNGISFDASVFDDVIESRKYKEYIVENAVPELITFGKEYLI